VQSTTFAAVVKVDSFARLLLGEGSNLRRESAKPDATHRLRITSSSIVVPCGSLQLKIET